MWLPFLLTYIYRKKKNPEAEPCHAQRAKRQLRVHREQSLGFSVTPGLAPRAFTCYLFQRPPKQAPHLASFYVSFQSISLKPGPALLWAGYLELAGCLQRPILSRISVNEGTALRGIKRLSAGTLKLQCHLGVPCRKEEYASHRNHPLCVKYLELLFC